MENENLIIKKFIKEMLEWIEEHKRIYKEEPKYEDIIIYLKTHNY